jgi:hypothetical protein
MQRGLLLAATWQQAIGHVWDAFLGPSALSPLAMFPRFPLKSILCYSDVLYLSTVLQRNDDPQSRRTRPTPIEPSFLPTSLVIVFYRVFTVPQTNIDIHCRWTIGRPRLS